jgi:hypothetical protein
VSALQKVSQKVRHKAVVLFSEKKARKWLGMAVLALVAVRIYFVQEMLAALALFTVVFIIFGIIAMVLYLVDRAGQWGLGWAGDHARLAAKLVRPSLTAVEDLSKKPFRRPRSEPVP